MASRQLYMSIEEKTPLPTELTFQETPVINSHNVEFTITSESKIITFAKLNGHKCKNEKFEAEIIQKYEKDINSVFEIIKKLDKEINSITIRGDHQLCEISFIATDIFTSKGYLNVKCRDSILNFVNIGYACECCWNEIDHTHE